MVKKDFGAGLNLSKPDVEDHPAGPPQREGLSQTERMFQVASTFLSGVLAINASQFIGAPLKFINPEYYDAYMAFTKQSFSVLVTTMTQWWAPTIVRVSGDASMHGQLQQMEDGSLRCNFPDRLVMMANHQLYTDWLYLWWIAYTNDMHGRVHIILKESLKKIPFIGWGAQFYNFIFVARKWEEDKTRFEQHLEKLNKPNYPMWLLIFPEGTNLSKTTREASKRWADKNGLEDMKHQLLPRSTGLRFCLEKLGKTTPWLYDCTIGYEGVPPGKFGQDIFTLRSSFFEGRPPKSVNMHWRRFRVADIPVHDEKQFEHWIRNRWREKDYLLEYFTRTGRFPTDQNWMLKETHQKANGDAEQRNKKQVVPSRYIETQVKSKSWEEFLLIFAPISAFVIVLFLFYNVSSGNMPGGDGEGAPKEWADVMNHAANMVNSASKLSQAQQITNLANADEEYAEDAASEQNPARPLLWRTKSSSSTLVGSQSGAPAKYRFVPAKGAAKPTRSAEKGPPKVIRLTNGKVVPLSEAFGPHALGTEGDKPSTSKVTSKGVKTATVAKPKSNQAAQKPTAAKPTLTTASGLKLKTAGAQKPSAATALKVAPSINGTKKASSTVPSVAAPVKSAKPRTVPIKKTAPKIGTQKGSTAAKAQNTPGGKVAPAPKKAAPKLSSKRQLANGMWVNADSAKDDASSAMGANKAKAGQSKQLANGVWIS